MDAIRIAYQQMCRAMPGGWATMAASLGMSIDALENRVYERRGQEITVHQARQMQANSGTTLFAEAIAADAGGVFVPIPTGQDHGAEEIMAVYMQLVDEVGRLSREWTESTADGVLDGREIARLEQLRLNICSQVTRMLQLSLQVFTPQQQESAR